MQLKRAKGKNFLLICRKVQRNTQSGKSEHCVLLGLLTVIEYSCSGLWACSSLLILIGPFVMKVIRPKDAIYKKTSNGPG